MTDPIDVMLLEAERITARLVTSGVVQDMSYPGMMFDPATGQMVPVNEDTKAIGFGAAEATMEQAAQGGSFFYVNEEVQAVIAGTLPVAPDMFYEPFLIPKDIGWMKFSKAIYMDADGEWYDKVLWSRQGEWLSVVWVNANGGNLMNYTLVMEQAKVSNVGLQTLFVTLHVLSETLVAAEDYQVRKHGHGRRKLRLKPLLIRKVILRRVVHPHDSDGAGSREYHCRWTVSSHWRMQPYRSTGAVRPRLIAAYVKGPEGMPLKAPTKTVFVGMR